MKNRKFLQKTQNSMVLAALTMSSFLFNALPASAMTVRGTIAKDNHTMAVGFNLNFGDDALYYRVSGSSVGVPRFWSIGRVDADYSGIRVTKEGYENGQRLQQSFNNYGMLYFHPRQRDLPRMALAGVNIQGSFVSNALDSGLNFRQLRVDGQTSSGFLNYSTFNGYHSAMNGLRFGGYPIVGYGDNGRFVFNYDGYNRQNILETNFSLGELKVTGTIQFSDRTSEHTSCTTDSDGNESCTTTTVVDATRGAVVWNITHNDGSDISIARPFGNKTTDDINLRSLIAFLELISADITQMR